MRSKAQNFEEYSTEAQSKALDWARKELAKGADPDEVLEQLSHRLIKKLQHPLIMAIKESVTTEFDAEASRKDYEEKYLKNHKPIADHVSD